MTARPHLVLVGLPGAGKSTVGPLLASALGVPFLDFDREIEQREGMSVTQIFTSRGEAAFRTLERELTQELAGRSGIVLAPGGGWMADEENVRLLRPPARIIHLEVSVPTAVSRLGADMDRRPLIAGEAGASKLEALAAARMPLYSRADAAISTEALTPQQVTIFGLRLASTWGWRVG